MDYSTLLGFLLLTVATVCMGNGNENTGCKRTRSDFNNCVLSQINSFNKAVKKGFPRLKIGSLDPLLVPKIRLKQGNGPVSIDLIATDQLFRGISNYNITSANVDLQQYKMQFSVYLPYLYVEGKSQISGRVLVLPIQGNGTGWSNYTEVSGKAVLKGHPVLKNNEEFFSLDSVKFDMDVKKGTIHMDNLFNGNQELGDAMNKLMTDNFEVVFEELKPVIDETVQELIKDIASKLLNRYSLDYMFPK